MFRIEEHLERLFALVERGVLALEAVERELRNLSRETVGLRQQLGDLKGGS